ncbi:Holo-[acyl-carrier-protein] synthase [compost metagenome]
MIFGIGHDVVEIDRVRDMLDNKIGDRMIHRILTLSEQQLPGAQSRSAEFVSGRFAAKEAISKAFGCGIGQQLGFSDMEIMPDEFGKPSVAISPQSWERLGLVEQEFAVHLSITHERHLASAFAVVERVK